VVATTNREEGARAVAAPANAVVVDWLSYSQVMPQASLAICHGGHGTVARTLAEGLPVLVCPAIGDMAETGARVAWAGVGLMLPRRLLRLGPVRLATRRLLGDQRFATQASAIAASGCAGPARAEKLLERYSAT
jgi:UDP:flavonoid glycosyltransferase YjiC (YdhE family)